MKLAKVDLSNGNVKIIELPREMEVYIGGKGVATKLLFQIPPKIDPLHPDNAIIFGVGPLNGVNLSGATRATAVFKSPVTMGYGESQCGGYFAYELKRTGIDFIYISGKAKNPVYLVVGDGVEVRNANHLWGRDCYQTEQILRKDEGGEVLSIGQAGENVVRFACVSHRKGRQFGRGGLGAVMGSKNLKAVVVNGKNDVEVADPEGLKEFRRWMRENIVSKLESMKKYGTLGIASITNEAGVLPTRYWEKGSFEDFERISAEAFEKYKERNTACYGCAVACGKIRKSKEIEVEGPEYETLFAFGPLCENSDPDAIIKANDLCDRYGMDTISAGNVVAFYMACCERGDLEGIRFGDGDAIIDVLRKIAFREGIGDILAEGVKIAREKLRVRVEAVHVKGLEPPGYDPRGLYGMALAYITSPRGACHMRSCAYRANLAGQIDRLSPEGQAKIVKDYEDFYCVVDSLVFCRFLCLPVIGMYWEDIARLYSIITGKEVSIDYLKKTGEMIWVLSREFNLREGVEDERLPSAFFKPVICCGEKKEVLTEEDVSKMIDEYKKLRNRTGYYV